MRCQRKDHNLKGILGFGGHNLDTTAIPNATGGIWASPAYWNNNVYFGGSGDNVKAFSFNAGNSGLLSGSLTSLTNEGYGFPGPTPSVSASGTSHGIVWVLDVSAYCTQQSPGCGPAILRAYDATNLATTKLWDSTQGAGNAAGFAVKFTVPTIANGRVYIGTRGNDTGTGATSILGELDVYGLK